MGAITHDNLTVLGIEGLISINKMVIDTEPNKHAVATIEAIGTDECLSGLYGISENDRISICTKDGEVLFKGGLAKYSQRHEGQLISLKMELISGSVEGDYQKRTRSFQKPDMIYDEIFRVMEKNYPLFQINNNTGIDSKTARPIFQFEESDFAFLRRIASELNTSLIVDSKTGINSITIGMPSPAKSIVSTSSKYAYRLSPKFYELGGEKRGLFPEDYSYYEVESYENLFIGDKITVNEEEMCVISRHAELVKGEVIFSYKAGRESLLQQKLIENRNLYGAAFKGTVKDVYPDTLTIELDVDKNYEKQELTEFDWKPITSNLLYAMPEKKTTAVIQHSDCMGYNVLATACIRTNGETCSNTKQPTEKMFYPDNSGNLIVGKQKVAFTMGDTKIELRDDLMYISTNVEFETMGNVDVSLAAPITDILSPSMIQLLGTGNSELNITQTIDGKGDSMVEGGTTILYYDPYNDTPQEVAMKRDWGKLITKLLIAAAIVLAVAALAAATVATGGAALGVAMSAGAAFKATMCTVVGTALIAGAISGMAVSVVGAINGDPFLETLYQSLDAFANGAITAVFAEAAFLVNPAYGIGTVFGTAILGSAMYQTLDMQLDEIYGHDYDDKDFSLWTTVSDLVAALFSFGVGKAIQKYVDSAMDAVRNATREDYFSLAKLANDEYGGNFRVKISQEKQTRTIPKRYIDDVKTYLLKAIENRYGKDSVFYETVTKMVDGGYALVYEAASDAYEDTPQITLNFKFDENDRLVILPQ